MSGQPGKTGLVIVRRWMGFAVVLGAAAACGCGAANVGAPAPREPDDNLRHIEVTSDAVERAALGEVPSLSPARVAVAVGFPHGFDPERVHPILITQVPGGSSHPNIAGLGAYAPTALAEDYVVLAAQGIPWPDSEKRDTLLHRYASVRAALRWLAAELPQSERWPIVLAGFSGGAKVSQVLAFSLTLENRRVAGMFLGGCNEDHSQLLLRQYPAAQKRFSQIAIFLSVGDEDRIAPPASVRSVAAQLRQSGVERLELSEYRGGHRLDTRELREALRWFRTQIQ
jgi:predicted esterase